MVVEGSYKGRFIRYFRDVAASSRGTSNVVGLLKDSWFNQVYKTVRDSFIETVYKKKIGLGI